MAWRAEKYEVTNVPPVSPPQGNPGGYGDSTLTMKGRWFRGLQIKFPGSGAGGSAQKPGSFYPGIQGRLLLVKRGLKEMLHRLEPRRVWRWRVWRNIRSLTRRSRLRSGALLEWRINGPSIYGGNGGSGVVMIKLTTACSPCSANSGGTKVTSGSDLFTTLQAQGLIA